MLDFADASSGQTEADGTEFYPGKTSQDNNVGSDVDRIAQTVADSLAAGSRATIAACAELYLAYNRLKNDDEAIQNLVDALYRKNLITANDKSLGRGSTKLSMLISIGRHAEDLTHPAILPNLHEGFSYIYQVVCLLNRCKGQISDVAKFFAERSGQGHATRAEIMSAFKKSGASTLLPLSIDGIQAVVATPSRTDISRLSQDYMPEGRPRCLSLQDHIATNAVIIVKARVRDLPVVVDKLIRMNGFSRISQILMHGTLPGVDIADVEVFIVAGRGSFEGVAVKESDFPSVCNEDACSISDRLFPEAAQKLHLFARMDVPAWECLNHACSWNRGEVQ